MPITPSKGRYFCYVNALREEMSITAIFYVLIFAAGMFMTLAGRTIVGLYVYSLSLYFHAPSQWWGEGLPLLRWSLIAAIITAVSLFIYPPKQKIKFWFYGENKLLSALMLLVFLQQFWAVSPSLHSEYIELLAKFLLLIFLIQNLAVSQKEVKGLIAVNIIGTAYLSYYGMSTMSSGRMESIGNGWDANLVAMHFAALLFLGGYYLLEKFRWFHLIIMASLAVILMGMFKTESRGAIMAMAITAVVAMFFKPEHNRKKMMLFGILGVIAASLLMGPQIIERFGGMKGNGEGEMEDKSAQSRIVVIKAQIKMWQDAFLLGHGHRGTLVLSPTYIEKEYQTADGVRASHNVAMSFLVDHGIIGFTLYFSAIFSCLFKIRKKTTPGNRRPSEIRNFYSTMLIGCCLSLLCFMIGGMGADNKKLEADIWMMALIPLIYHRLSLIDKGIKVD